MFEHMGMLCCHVLKIMDYRGMTEIPERHIVKRWTRDVRDVLPDHLQHYQGDQLCATALTFRHTRMYVKALELVKLEDVSVEAYERLMSLFEQAIVVMTPFEHARDGLGLEDRATNKQATKVAEQAVTVDSAHDRMSGHSNLLRDWEHP